MKKKILKLGLILITFAIMFTLVGCGDKEEKSKESENVESNNNKENVITQEDTNNENYILQEDKIENNKEEDNTTEVKEENYTLETGKFFRSEIDGNGAEIKLNSDGTVEQASWGKNAGASEYKGTYTIDGNTLTVTITQMYEFIEWSTIPTQVRKYTITDNNVFESEYNGVKWVYKITE